MNLTIAVIAKECVPGRVKTRLSPPLTEVQGARLAQASLSQTLRTVRSIPATRRLLVFDGVPRTVDANGYDVLAQVSGGLDERLAAICAASGGPLLILGMDTPQLAAGHLGPLLADWGQPRPTRDAWLGPAADGGYWALALQRPDGELIRGVPMSTGSTGRIQSARLAAAGLRVGLLPMLVDVDTWDDARLVASGLAGTAFGRTVEVMERALAGVPA